MVARGGYGSACLVPASPTADIQPDAVPPPIGRARAPHGLCWPRTGRGSARWLRDRGGRAISEPGGHAVLPPAPPSCYVVGIRSPAGRKRWTLAPHPNPVRSPTAT